MSNKTRNGKKANVASFEVLSLNLCPGANDILGQNCRSTERY